jgi:hypothetical protein
MVRWTVGHARGAPGIDLGAGALVLQARREPLHQLALNLRRGEPAHRSLRFKPLLLLGARARSRVIEAGMHRGGPATGPESVGGGS